jgi:hypothetical protein
VVIGLRNCKTASRAAARFTIIIGTMQLSMAIETALSAVLLGQIRIDFLQQLV